MYKNTVKADVVHLDSMRKRLDEFYDKKGFLKEPVNIHELILIVRELLSELRDTQEALAIHANK